MDADFGLVVNGGTFLGKSRIELTIGSFTVFGQGCPSASGCAPCLGRNWTRTSTNKTTTASQIAILDWTTERTQICGIDLFTRSRSGTIDVNVRIHDIDNNSQPGKLLAAGKVRVGTTLQVYSLRFPKPTVIGLSAIYFVVFDNADKLILPVSTTGKNFFHWEMRNNSWGNQLHDTTKWQFRIHCDKGNQIPVLSASGRPLIGTTIRFELDKTRGATPAVLFIGASDKTWGLLPLPFNYAASCKLLVSGEVLLAFVTDANGRASIPLAIPADKRLIGAIAFEQFLVLDSGNSAGLIASNGGRAKLGEF